MLTSQRVFEQLCVKIYPRVTSVGESGEKIKRKEKERPYISRISPSAPLPPIGTVWVACSSRGRNQLCKFYRNRI